MIPYPPYLPDEKESMREIAKEYNGYLDQIRLVLHPNLVDGFMKIHNKIVAAEVELAKTYKPSKEIEELEPLLIRYSECKEKAIKGLMLKNISTKIKSLYGTETSNDRNDRSETSFFRRGR